MDHYSDEGVEGSVDGEGAVYKYKFLNLGVFIPARQSNELHSPS